MANDVTRYATRQGYTLPRRHEVLLWSSAGSFNPGEEPGAPSVAGGFTDAVETHGGENNGAAQGRFCARTAKYASLPGLSWLNDVKSFGFFHSGHSADPVVGGGTSGQVNAFDYVHGGPNTRMEHVHVIDCAGYDYLKLYWQGVSLAYEGLAISNTHVMTLATGAEMNIVFGDNLRVSAAGMPAIDSSDSIFSLPSLMRMNANDSLALEGAGAGGGLAAYPTFTIPTNDNVTLSLAAVANDDIVTVSSSTTLPTGLAANTAYYVINAAGSGATCQLSLTLGGSAISITAGTGSGTHTMQLSGMSMPGSGRARPIPMNTRAAVTGSLWEPDSWVHGGDILWTQYKLAQYPGAVGTNAWSAYEVREPAHSWEKSSWNGPAWQGKGPPCIMQQGRVYKSANDILKNYYFTKNGNKFEATCWLGYPDRAVQVVSAPADTTTGNFATYQNDSKLTIKGLARIALTVGTLRCSWHGEGINGGFCYDQASRNSNAALGSTALASTPVGPATAPRQHLRGRLWAILTRD